MRFAEIPWKQNPRHFFTVPNQQPAGKDGSSHQKTRDVMYIMNNTMLRQNPKIFKANLHTMLFSIVYTPQSLNHLSPHPHNPSISTGDISTRYPTIS